MKIMAIDYGDARTGIAISDPMGLLSGHTEVIHSRRPEEVCAQVVRLAEAHGVEELVRDYITEENGDPETFGNARGVRNIFEHILVAQNNRLAAMETVTKEDLMTLTQDDVLHARGKLD